MASGDELALSTIAEKYQLLRLLGRGGMGAVYEARHVQTRRRCAVKLLRFDEMSQDGQTMKRFFREARAVGVIESENVVAAFDSGVDQNGRAFYVMEYLAGEDLSQLLKRVGLLAPRAALKIGVQAARGLCSAHALDIVHRDIKPANVFLAEGAGTVRIVKILDFGVAKVKMEAFDESAGAATQSGSLLGTLQYMSPTQLTRASAIDDGADIWSLGVLLFEALTGVLPWGATNGIGDVVNAILTKPLPRLREHAPWVGPEVAEVVERALTRNDAERYCNAGELRERLEALVGGDTTLQTEELVAPTDQERSVRIDPLMYSDTVDLRATSTDAPAVTSIRPVLAARNVAYVLLATAAAGAAALGIIHSSGGASESAAPPALAPVAARQPTATGEKVTERSATTDAPAMPTSTTPVPIDRSKPKPKARRAEASPDGRPVSRTNGAGSEVGPKDSSSVTAAPSASSSETTLERLGGSARWPNPDIVAPP